MSPIYDRIGGAVVSAGTFLANAIPSVANAGFDSWIPIIVQSGAVGILAFIIWQVFTTFIPRLLDAHEKTLEKNREEMAIQRREFLEAIKELKKP